MHHGLRQSNKWWLHNTLVQLVCLGLGQWLHCNDEKQIVSQPRHQCAEALLQQAIIWLYVQRSQDMLPTSKKRIFSIVKISRSVQYIFVVSAVLDICSISIKLHNQGKIVTKWTTYYGI